MQRLTVHLKNVSPVVVDGKTKSFNTLAFILKKGDEKEVQSILSPFGNNVLKSYKSNIN
jgi:hypothetical protein